MEGGTLVKSPISGGEFYGFTYMTLFEECGYCQKQLLGNGRYCPGDYGVGSLPTYHQDATRLAGYG